MVPEGAQIVSGMKMTPEVDTRPQHSLVIHSNNLDFDDWLAMIAVDPQVCANELVEVASSSPRGELTERLLLADGSFDAQHILRAALKSGAGTAEFAGVQVAIVLPFAREKEVSVGVRWLAFPDERTAIFGTPLLVQKALNRRAAHAQMDASLRDRLNDVPPNASDWNVIVMPADVFTRHLGNMFYAAAVLRALTHSDDLVTSIRYGRTMATIEFVAHTDENISPTSASLNARAQLLNRQGTGHCRVRLERIAVLGQRVTGIVTVAETHESGGANEMANR
jgi:hypothetical protein